MFVEDNDQIKLTTFKLEECIIEEHDAGVMEKGPNEDNHDVDKEEKRSITEEDGTTTAAERINGAATVKEKPVPLPRTTK